MDSSACEESNNRRDEKRREQEDGRNEAPGLCLCCTLGWEAPCLPPAKSRQDRETCSLLNVPKGLHLGAFWRAGPSESQPQILCYGHTSSCSCAGAQAHLILWDSVQGAKPSGKYLPFSSFPPPQNFFMLLCQGHLPP